VYASAILLGVLYQKGLMPFGEAELRQAFTDALPKAELAPNWRAFELGRAWVTDPTSVRLEQEFDESLLLEESVRRVAYPWQNAERFVATYKRYRNELTALLPEVPTAHIGQYVHDLIVFDQGKELHAFCEDVRAIKGLGLTSEELAIAVRSLAKTYWIKDEVFVSHLMVAPQKLRRDLERYRKLGSSFKVKHINRPAFVVFGRKVEFDFSPRPWMLELMRHLRVLRILMPAWHAQERQIAGQIRQQLLTINQLEASKRRQRLMELDNIKGYREVRYAKAKVLA